VCNIRRGRGTQPPEKVYEGGRGGIECTIIWKKLKNSREEGPVDCLKLRGLKLGNEGVLGLEAFLYKFQVVV